MGLPSDLLRRPPTEAARRIVLDLLEHASVAARRLDEDPHEEALHDFRVALRRLRSAVSSWRGELADALGRKHRRALRELQRATSPGRDAEVGLAWLGKQRETMDPPHLAGLAWMTERLEAQHERSMQSARTRVGEDFAPLAERLRERLAVLQLEVHLTEPGADPRFAEALASELRAHLRVLVEHLGQISSAADREEAHAARIRLKRLRYLLEPLDGRLAEVKPALKVCKRLQEILGELNDAHVMAAELVSALAEQAQAGGTPRDAATVRAGLGELARRAEVRTQSLFRALEHDWLGAGRDQLVLPIEELAAAAVKSLRAGVEIERKFLLSGLPDDLVGLAAQEIDQGWIPGISLRERVRRVRDGEGTRCFRTIKLGSGLERIELEDPATPDVFEALWPLTEGARVRKRRYRVEHGDLVWEIDEFQDRDLWLAEVELPDASTQAEPPAWLAPWVVREVTEERGFTNLELAK